MGYFAARRLMYFNLTCGPESLFAFKFEIVRPFLGIHSIGDKAVFPMLTVGLFTVVFDVVEVNLANGERERLNVLLLCGHKDSVKCLVWTSD